MTSQYNPKEEQKGHAVAAVSTDKQEGEPHPGLPFPIPPDATVFVSAPEYPPPPAEEVPEGLLCAVEGHVLTECNVFLGMSIKMRRAYVAVHEVCYNCLKKGNMANKCELPPGCDQCPGRHHKLLHAKQPNAHTAKKAPAGPGQQPDSPKDAAAVLADGEI